MQMLPASWKRFTTVLLFLTVSVFAQAMITFSFPASTGSQSDYKQFGPMDALGPVDGPYGIATYFFHAGGPPYQLHVTVNTNNPPGTYFIGWFGYEDVYVILY